MLDGNTTDTIEGSSLSYRNNYIHIYSCAWGPKDDGKRFGRPGTLASKALQLGTKEVSVLFKNFSFPPENFAEEKTNKFILPL